MLSTYIIRFNVVRLLRFGLARRRNCAKLEPTRRIRNKEHSPGCV